MQEDIKHGQIVKFKSERFPGSGLFGEFRKTEGYWGDLMTGEPVYLVKLVDKKVVELVRRSDFDIVEVDYSKKLEYRTLYPSLEQVQINGDNSAIDSKGNMIVFDTCWKKPKIVKAENVKRVRKYVRGILLDVYFCGYHTDDKGRKWECWTPNGITLSAWVRLESEGKRPKMLYDAGSHWRRTLDQK